MAEYAGWHPTIREIIGSTPRLLRQALYDREPLPEWRVGRVALLGHAAHPMLPFFAQGAAQSTEDAYVLAGCSPLSRAIPSPRWLDTSGCGSRGPPGCSASPVARRSSTT